MTKRAFIYTRISQDRGSEGLGVQRQEEACRDYARQLGMDVVEAFSDNSVSAYSGRLRPGYTAMLERLRAREVDAVICWRMDRLHRRPIELEEYAEVCEGKRRQAPILTYAVTAGGEIDLSTADGLLRAGIMGQVARFESATKSDRARSKAAQLAQAGLWTGGRRPFGWLIEEGRLVIEPREAAALTAAHNDVLAGRSLGSIIKSWNDEGWEASPLLTTAGKPWGYAQLRQALLRPRNAGLYVSAGEIISRDQIPPIVPEDVWRAVVAVLKNPERRRSQSNKAVHLLSGIAQCHCGELLRSGSVHNRIDRTTTQTAKFTAYRCPAKGRGHVGKREEYVDAVVEMWVFRLLAQAQHDAPQSASAQAEAEALRAQLEALHVREQQAGALLADGELTPTQLRDFNQSIRRQRTDLESQLTRLGLNRETELSPLARFDHDMAGTHKRFNAWLALPIDDRRDFIRTKLHVVLHPHTRGTARVFDPDTVSVHLKRRGESRHVLSAEEIKALDRTSISDHPDAPDSVTLLAMFRANRRGSEYNTAFKTREASAKTMEEYPGLREIMEERVTAVR
jgi:site-specific DNA recombinase